VLRDRVGHLLNTLLGLYKRLQSIFRLLSSMDQETIERYFYLANANEYTLIFDALKNYIVESYIPSTNRNVS
jgi:hypothetical protein